MRLTPPCLSHWLGMASVSKTMNQTMLDLRKQLAELRTVATEQLKGYPRKKLGDGSEVLDLTQDQHNELRNRGAEMDALGVQLDAEMRVYQVELVEAKAKAELEAKAKKVTREPFGGETRSVGTQVLESEQFKNRQGGKFAMDVQLTKSERRALVYTDSGFDPFVARTGEVVPIVSRPVQLIDFLPVVPTTQNAIKFMKQSTRTNAAVATAEGNAAGEATLIWTEATVPVVDIPVWIPVTQDQLDDEPGLRALIEQDLILMVRQTLDSQATVGAGTGAEMTGLYNATGAQSQALGGDTLMDCVLKAMVKLMRSDSTSYGGCNPNVVCLRHDEFQDLVLAKDAENRYMWGSPVENPGNRLWGIQVVKNDALGSGTGMVLDTMYTALRLREDASVDVSEAHGELFTAYTLAMRARARAALQIKRDAAICKLTGI